MLVHCSWSGAGLQSSNHFALMPFVTCARRPQMVRRNLVDPASSHMLVSKIKPCMSQYKLLYGETANGSLKQL